MYKILISFLLVVSLPSVAVEYTPIDTTQAVKLVKKADKILKKGKPNSEYEAIELYKQAAEMGLVSAQRELQNYYYSEGMIANALKWTEKLAEHGDADAEYAIGYGYLLGENAEGYNSYFIQNYEKGFYWMKRAVSHENADASACVLLASCYEYGYGVEVDLVEAVKWYGIAAEKGNVVAMEKLAMAYYDGIGVEKDNDLAVKWVTKSAEAGYSVAQYNLGYFYHVGDIVKQDYDEAIYWYTKAADQGEAAAKNNLAVCMETKNGNASNSEIVYLYREGAEKGDEMAQYNLGNCYLKGEGVAIDPFQAFYWYKKSAEKGCSQGQFSLGNCYYDGIGTEVSHEKAFYWYQQSAEQNDSIGMCNLSSCYFNGIGTEVNPDKGFYWCKKSAEMGTKQAIRDLGICYRDGIGTQQDVQKALELFQEAAYRGYVLANVDIADTYVKKNEYSKAIKYYKLVLDNNSEDYTNHYNIAICFFNIKDYKNALNHYKIAAEGGFPQAMYNLALMYYNGQGTNINISETKRWMKKAAEQDIDSETKKFAKEAIKILNQ